MNHGICCINYKLLYKWNVLGVAETTELFGLQVRFVFPVQVMWYYCRELFLSNFVLFSLTENDWEGDCVFISWHFGLS